MAPGGPAASSRGRGGKFKKYTRGGGKHFSRDLQPVDSEGNHISMWSADARAKDDDDDDDESSSEEEEDESEDDAGAAGPSNEATSREDRKALKKARKEAAIAKQKSHTVEVGDLPSSDEDEDEDDDMPANPNHSKAARNQAKAPREVEAITEGVANMKAPGSRKEREAMEAAAAKERYMKLHAEGKTDEAKADLARLKLIREQRAAEAARRQAEKEEREEQEKARKAEIEAKEAKKREFAAGPKAKKGKK
ncbi:casein kinase substrate phosphoprotein PP28-domain-containing protein [Stachybotrys elegans]|uniref:Casein kinase substrate phosphoprotein PP28-domain-containing protein n=1 Tax=Stachybotrys elegans TaxID=80388 RepID=A0A8K0WUU4_9HYPO|nr:casein kinase substrate phosphoprotein PP28-domain-containing protein [Stachybotrys elegans]